MVKVQRLNGSGLAKVLLVKSFNGLRYSLFPPEMVLCFGLMIFTHHTIYYSMIHYQYNIIEIMTLRGSAENESGTNAERILWVSV